MGSFFQLVRDLFYSLFRWLLRLVDPRQWRLPKSKPKGVKARFRISLPFVWALFAFLSCGIILSVYYLRGTEANRYWFDDNWPFALLIVFLFSGTIYYLVRFLLQDEYETFDDIEDAWELGLAELQRHQLDIGEIPVFLVIGAENRSRMESLFRAAQLGELPISGYPSHGAALHWYANYRAIFVVCTEVGCLTEIARRAGAELVDPSDATSKGAPRADATLTAADLNRTFWPSEQPTLDDPDEHSSLPSLMGAGLPEGAGLDRTLMVDTVDEYLKKRDEGGVTLKKDFALRSDERDEQFARMANVCRLLNRARSPHVPINGLVALFPINLILCDASDGASVEAATHDDIATIVEWLQLRCPAFAVVTDWEDDPGFQEMIRRLGPAMVHQYRFGKGARNVCNVPNKPTIGAISEWACRAYEDWIYRLFAQPDALEKPGNRSLYSLLCKIRRYLRPRIERILTGSFATSHEQRPNDVPFFAGCYFVAAGKQPGHRAFVPALFKRIIAEAGKVEWTDEAIASDRRSRRVAMWLFSCTLFFVGLLILLIFWPTGH